MTLFALDIGNKQTKVISERGAKVYPSFFTLNEEVGESMNVFEKKLDLDKFEVKFDEDFEYAWGKDINKVDTSNIFDTLNFNNRYSTHEFKLLTSFALGQLAREYDEAENDVLKVEIVTGVPTNDFNKENVKDIIKFLEGSHDITINDIRYKLIVQKVHVLPQPLGTIYHEMLNDQGELTDQKYQAQNVTVCDIGGGTLLVDTFKNLKLDPKQRVQKDTGTHNLYDRIVKKAITEKNLNGITEYKVEEIVRSSNNNKFYFKPNSNESIDITDIVTKTKKIYSREVINTLNTTLKNKSTLDVILFTGGGSNIIDHDYANQQLKYSVFVDNPEFANVNGYFKYGKAVTKKEGEHSVQ